MLGWLPYGCLVARSYRFAGRPVWLGGHLLVLAAVVAMVLLGRWQLDVSNAKHFSLQNFGYALQWWAFSVFAVVMWLKILRDRASASVGAPSAEPPVSSEAARTYRHYVMPQSVDRAGSAADPQRAAYNAYLASLAEKGEK